MTTEPERGSRETLPVEQLAGHHVGGWITLQSAQAGISSRAGAWSVEGYLIGLEVDRAVIDDTQLCEASSRYVEHNNYTVTIYGHGQFRLHPGAPVTVEPADPALGVALARVQDSLRSGS